MIKTKFDCEVLNWVWWS